MRWDTPVSDAGSLRMVSLVDDGTLTITLEDAHSEHRDRWRFTFPRVVGYLNLLEEYRTVMPGKPPWPGWTVQVHDSPWSAYLLRTESMLELHYPHVQHYQIRTEDDVIDVLTEGPPAIASLGPAPADSPPAGKSQVIYLRGKRKDDATSPE